MAMDNQQTVQKFYEAFKKADAETMAACYADHASFSDPVFPQLTSHEVRGMWRMLCGRSRDLKLDYQLQKIDDQHFKVTWNASYTFSKTGRMVHNRIEAHLELDQGRIIRHQDNFDFWRWSRQAFGVPGWLLGWSPILRNAVRKEAAKALQNFLKGKN
jgi:ketosteroid isomerase-like protein